MPNTTESQPEPFYYHGSVGTRLNVGEMLLPPVVTGRYSTDFSKYTAIPRGLSLRYGPQLNRLVSALTGDAIPTRCGPVNPPAQDHRLKVVTDSLREFNATTREHVVRLRLNANGPTSG